MTDVSPAPALSRRMLPRSAGFLANTLVSAAVSIVAVALVIRIAGPDAWSSLALGQTVGAFAAVLVGYGWALYGAVEVARRADERERGRYYADSLLARAMLLIAVAPVYVLATVLVVDRPGDDPAALVAGLTLLSYGVSGQWYFIGAGDPLRLFLLDSLPRLVGTTLGLAALPAEDGLLLFVALQACGALAAVLLTARHVLHRGRIRTSDLSLGRAAAGLRSMFSGMFVTVSSSATAYLPVVIVSIVDPVALPAFAFADKFQKFTSALIAPVAQTAQAYVPHGGDAALRSRITKAVGWGAAASLACGAIFALLLPVAAEVVTGGSLSVGPFLAVGFAVVLAAASLSGVVGVACLVTVREPGTLVWGAGLGAFTGLPVAFLAGLWTGWQGVMWAVAGAQCCVVVLQLVALGRWLRSHDVKAEPR